MIDAAVFHCNKNSKLHCEREQKLQRVPQLHTLQSLEQFISQRFSNKSLHTRYHTLKWNAMTLQNKLHKSCFV